MKKTLIILVLSLVLFSCEQAPLIEDYKIEGIGLGDSLLDHLSESEIIAEIELNKSAYNYLNDDFGEVYLFDNLDTYDRMSFFVKQKDKNYTIYSLKGSFGYDNKLEECFARQKEIEEEFSSIYKNAEKSNYSHEFPFDPTGESVTHNIQFTFDSGDFIEVRCAKYNKSLKIKNNWEDSLQVTLIRKEVMDWFDNPIK